MTIFYTNPFELDVIELYNSVNKYIENITVSEARKSRYLFKIRSDIRHYCRLSCINYNMYFKQRKSLIIPSGHFLYFRFLPVALAHLPVQELHDFLDYQHRHYDGNILASREEFKSYLKENIAEEVNELSFTDRKIRVSAILNWVG